MVDIQKDEIKLMASQVLADTEDGGGQMTSNEIVDGNVNNLFPDISRLDRTYGRVSLRKAYMSVQTADRATYYGSHIALTEQAADPLVNTTLFTTEDWFDVRENCRNRIESYLVKGPIFTCALWGDHYAGSKAITVFTQVGWPLPENGEVFVIIKTKDVDGFEVTPVEQFIRITQVESEVREFADDSGSFEKQVITINFGTQLENDLLGWSPSRSFLYGETSYGTVIHTAVTADISKYFGVAKLTVPVVKDSLSVKVDGTRKALVPSTTSQAAITDFTVGTLREAIIVSSGAEESKITIPKSLSVVSGQNTILVGIAIEQGSLELTVDGVGSFTDNSKGVLLNSSGNIAGSVVYSSGTIVFTANSSRTTTASVVVHPAVAAPTFTETGQIAIQEQNRGYVYIFNCTPSPVKGTVKIDFLSNGKWYSLYDQSTGELKGLEDGIGSGTINFETGSISMTLGGMPDVNSSILIYWGTPVFTIALEDYMSETTSGESFDPSAQLIGELSTTPNKGDQVNFIFPISAGSYRVYGTVNASIYSWSASVLYYEYIDPEGTTYTGTCGWIHSRNYAFELTRIPENVTTFSVTYHDFTPIEESITTAFSSPTISVTLNNIDPIAPESLTGKAEYLVADLSEEQVYEVFNYVNGELVYTKVGSSFEVRSGTVRVYFYDDGLGNLLQSGTDNTIGSIDYNTGAISLQSSLENEVLVNETDLGDKVHGLNTTGIRAIFTEVLFNNETPIDFAFSETTTISNTATNDVTISASDMVLTLEKHEKHVFVAGSVMMEFNSKWFIDNGFGELHCATSDQIFSINYSTGEISPLNDFEPFSMTETAIDDIKGVLTIVGDEIVKQWVFRTPGSPITPSSFTIQAVTNEGDLIEATGDFDGVIESAEIHGTIIYDTGIVEVAFGVWTPIPDPLPDSTATEEEWLNVTGYETDEAGNYFKPLSVQTESIVMNCVVETYVPLNADLLGLNPVRLPLDGKVPIFRDGDIILIHHTQTEVVTPTAGTAVALSRSNVNLIELYDNAGVYIPEMGNYSVDLTAGTITFEDPLDLSAYTSPFQVMHRIEDMVLTTDVQITGHMSISQPLQHDYPADETLVSSVLPIGDVQARVWNLFTDSSWDDIWSDMRQHGPTTAQYDLVNYPIVVTNEASVKERFAFIFSGTNTVDVVGEHLGVILSNAPITSDIAPINPANGQAYFTIKWEGWGEGWNVGEVLRFNTDAGNYPVWFCRTTQQGPATENSDHYTIQVRGDSS